MHVVKTKKSHFTTPRIARDAQYNWSAGSEHYNQKMTTTDKFAISILAFVAFAGLLTVIVSLVGVIN